MPAQWFRTDVCLHINNPPHHSERGAGTSLTLSLPYAVWPAPCTGEISYLRCSHTLSHRGVLQTNLSGQQTLPLKQAFPKSPFPVGFSLPWTAMYHCMRMYQEKSPVKIAQNTLISVWPFGFLRPDLSQSRPLCEGRYQTV